MMQSEDVLHRVVQPPAPPHVTLQSALVPQFVVHFPTSQPTSHVLEEPQVVVQSPVLHSKLQVLLVLQLQLAPLQDVAPGIPELPEVPEVPPPEVPEEPGLPPSAPAPIVKS